jgi:hypothetical protein
MRTRFMADFIGRQCQRVAMALLVLTVASATTVWAQAGGAIGGSVLDESGAALPGATVTVTNLSNGFSETFVTGERGNYRAVALPPATYEIRVELSGFAIVTRRIVLTVGTDATVDIKLGIASVTENVTVVGETALVEVNRSQPRP